MHTMRGQIMRDRLHITVVLFLQVLFLHNHNITAKGEYINSSANLEKWLSNEKGLKNVKTDIFLELDSTVEYQLAPNIFTVLTNVNLTIISDSNDKSVDIHCSNGLHYHHTRGLAFVNSTITIKRVAFHNCGMNLRALSLETLTLQAFNYSKPFYYSSSMAAVILLIESRALFSYVSFNSSYGFAIIGFNLINSLFEYGMVYHSMNLKKEFTIHSIGSGMMIHFGNIIKWNNQLHANVSYTVNFSQMIFKENFDHHYKINCFPNPSYYSDNSHILVPNAPGLTILNSKQNARVIIDETRFFRNIGSYYGSVLIMNFDNVTGSRILIKNLLFEKSGKFKVSDCRGDALQFLWYWETNDHYFTVSELFVIENLTFSNNTGRETWNEVKYYANALIRIETFIQNVSITYKIKSLICINNTFDKVQDSACLAINRQTRYFKSKIIIVMENTTVKNNSELDFKPQPCIFKFSKVKAHFVGISHFSNNNGSAVCGVDSGIFLHGQMTFTNNAGINGGGLRIEGYGFLHFMTGVQLTFIDNKAYSAGGAIYVNSYSDSICGLQTNDPTPINVSFINNKAKFAGNSLFLAPIHRCINHNIYHARNEIKHLYHQLDLSKTEPRGMPLQLSTVPTHFHVYTNISFPMQIYPGEIVTLSIQSEDDHERVVFSVFEVELYDLFTLHGRKKNDFLDIWLQQYGINNIVENTLHQPPFNISVHTNGTAEHTTHLIISVSNIIDKKSFSIHLFKCPLGFAISERAGSCECDKIFQKIEHTLKVECYISYRTIRRPQYINFWLGSINNSYTGLSSSCPTTYCAFEPTYNYIKSTDNSIVLTNSRRNNTRPFCSYNRTGTLCGTCDPKYNLSVVFGTSDCRECSDVWLFTIPIYAIAGPVLIIILYSFNLTLTTGKLNGIIFYAQIANAGLMESLSLPIYIGRYSTMGYVRHVCFTLLSLLNLNLGYPICFYNGMNQLWKTGFSFVFPVYLLLIVVLIIMISRYSTWLSNKTSHSSVQVLVTVVHLSFSKLLLALIDVFTPATVNVSDKPPLRVWYWDGSVQYMTDHGHLLLAIISVLIVSVCLIPYVSILILGKVIIRYSKRGKLYLRPVYEAIHAPYKEGKQLWFVARLIILVLIYLMYVFLRTRNISILYILIASLLAMYLIGQTVFRPYKSKGLVILDCWLLINIIMIFVALRSSITSTNATNFILVAVILALASFTIVLIHHVCMRNAHIRAGLLKFKTLIQHTRMSDQQILTSRPNELQNASYYESCDECREPLLDQLIDND